MSEPASDHVHLDAGFEEMDDRDVRLGAGVAELGGLHVIGTSRHDSSRVDRQLRGRAGRQGDPGSSQFFVSLQDPLFVQYADAWEQHLSSCDQLQRVAEGQSLDCRLFLRKYESVVEDQRQRIADRRQRVMAAHGDLERLVTLQTIDDLWSDYLAEVSELRASTIWVSLGGGNPFREYLRTVHEMFQELTRTIDEEIAARLQGAATDAMEPRQRGATWTHLTTDEPFGTMTGRLMRRLAVLLRSRQS